MEEGEAMTELRQKQPRIVCPGYLAWLRKQPCACGCGSPAPSDAAHLRAGSVLHGKRPTGMSEKPSDCWALPLKHAHHMAQHDFGDELVWWSRHGIDPFKLAMKYFEEYAAQADMRAERKEFRKAVRLERSPKHKAKIPSRPFPKRKRS
jgi:hypothetical protein